MYILLRGLVMDCHNSLSLTYLSLQYRFANVLTIWTLFLLLKTFWHDWSDVVTLCNELLYITSFDLYTISMSFSMQPNTISQFLTLFTSWLNFSTEHNLIRKFTHCNVLLGITLYYQFWTVYRLWHFWCNLISQFSRSLNLDSHFTDEHVLPRMVTPCNAL
jgi:hypothetical protein